MNSMKSSLFNSTVHLILGRSHYRVCVSDDETTMQVDGVVVSMFDIHRSDRGSNPGRSGKIS